MKNHLNSLIVMVPLTLFFYLDEARARALVGHPRAVGGLGPGQCRPPGQVEGGSEPEDRPQRLPLRDG